MAFTPPNRKMNHYESYDDSLKKTIGFLGLADPETDSPVNAGKLESEEL
jgi:hypothetical protein